MLAGTTPILVHNTNGCGSYSNLVGGNGITATLDGEGIMELAVKTGPGTPRGGEMFNSALAHFGGKVTGVKGYWQNGGTMSDNLDSFNAALRSGMSLEDAATMATFTGKMSTRNGFNNSVEFVELRGNYGHYTNVGVIFR
ncbi:hypothetical protein [Streptosporangium sp. NPDC003464]